MLVMKTDTHHYGSHLICHKNLQIPPLNGALEVPLYDQRTGGIGTATPSYIALQKYIVQSFVAKDNSWLLLAHAYKESRIISSKK